MSPEYTASITAERYSKWAKVNVDDMPFLQQSQLPANIKKSTGLPAVYNVFLVTAALLAVFFTVSLVLAFTTQYFIDWGSALVGFLGTAGLAVVAWFSKQQIKS